MKRGIKREARVETGVGYGADVRTGVVLATLVMLFVFAIPSYGQELVSPSRTLIDGRAYRVSVQGGLRVQQGEALELVYLGPWLLSELTWDISDLLYVGGEIALEVGSRLSLQAGYWHAVTSGNGRMTDYDFLLPGVWTDYSEGPVDINSAYEIDVRADWRLLHWGGVSLHALGGYQRLYWDWSEYGSDYIYSVDGFRDARGSFPAGQNGINYDQTFDIPYIGVGWGLTWQRLSGRMNLLYSPLVQAVGQDEHVLRDLYFEDTFRNIDYFGLELTGRYRFGDRCFVAGAVDLQGIPEARGDMKITDRSDGSEEELSGVAGIANHTLSLTLTVGLLF